MTGGRETSFSEQLAAFGLDAREPWQPPSTRTAKQSTEENAVEEVIYQHISKWTGYEVRPGSEIPFVVRPDVDPAHYAGFQMDYGFWRPPDPSRDPVKAVLQAAIFESPRTLIEQRKRLTKLGKALLTCADALSGLQDEDVHILTPLRVSAVPEENDLLDRLLLVSGPVASLHRLIRSSLKKTDRIIANIDERLPPELEKKAGRPKNIQRHMVALELARLYRFVTDEHPTYSENRDGLSGKFTPLVRDVFNEFGWKNASLRGPVEAARDYVEGRERMLHPYLKDSYQGPRLPLIRGAFPRTL
ncbi:MAG: hypothetical protein NXI02_31110 [Rhodobacteraceae bacterium]|nr:hypothetical protein [Paracoccaceae bacterium]